MMHKSWETSRRNGSSLYRLAADFVSKDHLLVSPVYVANRSSI